MTIDERAQTIAAEVGKDDRTGGVRQRVYEVAKIMLQGAREDGERLARMVYDPEMSEAEKQTIEANLVRWNGRGPCT